MSPCCLSSVDFLCSVLRLPCSVLRTPCFVLRAPCSVIRALCSVIRALCFVLRALSSVLRFACSVLCAPNSVFRAPCTVLCAVCSVCNYYCNSPTILWFVPLWDMSPSVINSVPCDWIVQRAYSCQRLLSPFDFDLIKSLVPRVSLRTPRTRLGDKSSHLYHQGSFEF